MKTNCVKQHVSSQHQRRCAGTLHLSLSLARPLVCPAQADLMTVLSLRRFSGVCSPAEDEDTCPGHLPPPPALHAPLPPLSWGPPSSTSLTRSGLPQTQKRHKAKQNGTKQKRPGQLPSNPLLLLFARFVGRAACAGRLHPIPSRPTLSAPTPASAPVVYRNAQHRLRPLGHASFVRMLCVCVHLSETDSYCSHYFSISFFHVTLYPGQSPS